MNSFTWILLGVITAALFLAFPGLLIILAVTLVLWLIWQFLVWLNTGRVWAKVLFVFVAFVVIGFSVDVARYGYPGARNNHYFETHFQIR